jgi:integrase
VETRPTTAITLDTIHPKKDCTLPIKLRVIFERKARYYAVSIELRDGTIIDGLKSDELKEIKADKPKRSYKEMSLLLADKEKFANEIINELKEDFSFDAFKERFSGIKKSNDSSNVFYHYDQAIKDLEKNNQFGTASSYELSMKSLKTFIKNNTGKEPTKLAFKEITVKWLQSYETFMTSDKITTIPEGKVNIKEGHSRTTVGIYLRPLRALFNTAISLKDIDSSVYPFGKRKYKIPKGRKVKKALSQAQLILLKNAEPKTPEQERARDFFFFSYACNGMNIKDICLLKNENVENDTLNFFRAKTRNTNKDQSPVNVTLTTFPKRIIEKYRNPDKSSKALLFPLTKIELTDPEQVKRLKIQHFTKFINQHLKKLALSVGITEDISTYFARHTFATMALENGANVEFVSEALAHSNIKTTQAYLAGFSDETKKGILEKNTSFLN